MSRYGSSYQTANSIQKTLVASITEGKTTPRGVVCCANAWLELENFKREIRGIPRLKPVDADKFKEQQRRQKKPRQWEIVESDPTKIAGN